MVELNAIFFWENVGNNFISMLNELPHFLCLHSTPLYGYTRIYFKNKLFMGINIVSCMVL